MAFRDPAVTLIRSLFLVLVINGLAHADTQVPLGLKGSSTPRKVAIVGRQNRLMHNVRIYSVEVNVLTGIQELARVVLRPPITFNNLHKTHGYQSTSRSLNMDHTLVGDPQLSMFSTTRQTPLNWVPPSSSLSITT